LDDLARAVTYLIQLGAKESSLGRMSLRPMNDMASVRQHKWLPGGSSPLIRRIRWT